MCVISFTNQQSAEQAAKNLRQAIDELRKAEGMVIRAAEVLEMFEHNFRIEENRKDREKEQAGIITSNIVIKGKKKK